MARIFATFFVSLMSLSSAGCDLTDLFSGSKSANAEAAVTVRTDPRLIQVIEKVADFGQQTDRRTQELGRRVEVVEAKLGQFGERLHQTEEKADAITEQNGETAAKLDELRKEMRQLNESLAAHQDTKSPPRKYRVLSPWCRRPVSVELEGAVPAEQTFVCPHCGRSFSVREIH
jgi:peptidoglycan hydrolase CwlO-like protein